MSFKTYVTIIITGASAVGTFFYLVMLPITVAISNVTTLSP